MKSLFDMTIGELSPEPINATQSALAPLPAAHHFPADGRRRAACVVAQLNATGGLSVTMATTTASGRIVGERRYRDTERSSGLAPVEARAFLQGTLLAARPAPDHRIRTAPPLFDLVATSPVASLEAAADLLARLGAGRARALAAVDLVARHRGSVDVLNHDSDVALALLRCPQLPRAIPATVSDLFLQIERHRFRAAAQGSNTCLDLSPLRACESSTQGPWLAGLKEGDAGNPLLAVLSAVTVNLYPGLFAHTVDLLDPASGPVGLMASDDEPHGCFVVQLPPAQPTRKGRASPRRAPGAAP